MLILVQSKIDEVAKAACVKVQSTWKQLSFCLRGISIQQWYAFSALTLLV